MAKKDDVEELKKMKYDEKSEFFQIFLDLMALFFSCLDFNLNKYVVAGEKLRMQWEKATPVFTKIFF